MDDFRRSLRSGANAIAAQSQATPGAEGRLFDAGVSVTRFSKSFEVKKALNRPRNRCGQEVAFAGVGPYIEPLICGKNAVNS
jgi:hypothetical protein